MPDAPHGESASKRQVIVDDLDVGEVFDVPGGEQEAGDSAGESVLEKDATRFGCGDEGCGDDDGEAPPPEKDISLSDVDVGEAFEPEWSRRNRWGPD